MNKSSLILIVCLIIFSACKNTNRMTVEEIALIEKADTITPMRVLKIENAKDSLLLRSKSKDVDYKKDRVILQKLINRLKATMIAESGVGIAAPQVGILRNIFLFVRIDKPEHPVEVAINPTIIAFSEEKYIFEGDGCLSVPDRKGNSLRYKWIDVEYLNEEGYLIRERLFANSRLEDFTGVIFQHEFDHLNGILYIDKLVEKDE